MNSARLDACKGRIDGIRAGDVPWTGQGEPRDWVPIAAISQSRLPDWIALRWPRKQPGILRDQVVAAASAALALAPAPTRNVMLQNGSP